MKNVLVVGAGSALGMQVVLDLRRQAIDVTATFRREHGGVADRIAAMGATPVQIALENRKGFEPLLAAADASIFLPLLNRSATMIEMLPPDHLVVFMSSNNVLACTTDASYDVLRMVETRVRNKMPGAVILRPTMIYGYDGDHNVSQLVDWLRRWPVMLHPKAEAKRQPVYYKDLSQVVVNTALNGEFAGREITVAGPDIVSQRALIHAVARTIGRQRLLVPVPLGPAKFLIKALKRLGFRPPVSSEQIERAHFDKTARGDDIIVTDTRLADALHQLVSEIDG